MTFVEEGAAKKKIISCGVVITDGHRIILGHPTGSTRVFDLPKGQMEPGETPEETARRELWEETGLTSGALRDHGLQQYLDHKDLWIFSEQVSEMPPLTKLYCRATYTHRGRKFPEFDRFALVTWDRLEEYVRPAMLPILMRVREELGY
jgi:8-oxo-dGTP pyrophosphatase MutT (NUDIX family)